MFSIKRWFLWQLKFFLLRIIKKTKFKANWRSIVSNSKIGNNCDVGCSDLNEVTLGDYSYINSGKCYLANIGKFCSIGQNVKIGGFATHPQNISTHPSFFHVNPQIGISFNVDETHKDYIPIEIGNDVWIGDNVFVIDGVNIGTGSIIGAGAIVTKDIPPYCIAAGVPAKELRKRFNDDEIQNLLKSKWWDFSDTKLRELSKYIGSDDISKFFEQIKKIQ